MRKNLIKGLLLSVLSVAMLVGAAPAKSPGDLPADASARVADAAMQRDAEMVKMLLQQGEDVNAAQGDGMTALHWSAMNGDLELVDMLLYAGANVKATTRLGAFTPLFLASKTGQAGAVEKLLAAGADASATTTIGTTPLMMASASGNVEAVKLLVEDGALLDAKESDKGRTALMFASAYNRADVVQYLASKGADVSAATEVVDAGELDKAYGKARGEREKQRLAQAKKAAEAEAKKDAAAGKVTATESNATGTGGRAAASEEDEEGGGDPNAKKEGKGLFATLFGWLPGVSKGEPERQEGQRRFERTAFGEYVGGHGGLTPLLFAARQGNQESVEALLEAGADINQVSEGDGTSPLLIATINGHFDVAKYLLEHGADPMLANHVNGATPLYGAINVQWAPKALYPQPRAYTQQRISYLDMMKLFLDAGAEPNIRLTKKVWFSSYNFDLSGVDEEGATPFWRAAYAADIPAMKLLISYGADPTIPTVKTRARRFRTREGEDETDKSGLPEVPMGGPSVTPLLAAAGVGYGKGFAANSHRFHPAGQLAAVKYLIEELHADVNARDHEGYNALHHAASRGDTEMVQYLVEKGCDVMAVSREGQTTADMANGPVQRVQPFPETLALLEGLGAVNNNNCVSC